MSHSSHTESFDVIVVGGGIAGAVATWALRDSGLSVALVDERPQAPALFRAERVSNQAITQLIEWGHRDAIEAVGVPLTDTAMVKGGKIERHSDIVDYSIQLWQLVSEMRRRMEGDSRIEVIADTVTETSYAPSRQHVVLKKSQRTLDAKLLVIATGSGNGFLKLLGISRDIISKNHSSTFGFDILPGAGFCLPASSISIRICKDGADYMNIFPTPDGRYRANLFTYWGAGDPRQKEFIKGDTTAVLKRLLPRISEITGKWTVGDRVDCGAVSVMKSKGFQKPGFVLIGDAYGRVCPCAGRGINKVISDVGTLIELAPSWIANNTELTAEELDSYYNHPVRAAFEKWVFDDSLMIRKRVLSKSPLWMYRRLWYHHVPQIARDVYWKYWGSRKCVIPVATSSKKIAAHQPPIQKKSPAILSGGEKQAAEQM